MLVALLLAFPPPAAAQAASGRVAQGLAAPVDLAFAPDGRLLYAELETGVVRELRPDGTPGEPIVDLPASPGGNGGFTGLAVDPADARTLYVVYSTEKASAPHGKVNRVSKVVDGQETVLLDDLPWAEFHVGGRVAVGPDGFLYVTTGDNGGPTGQDYTREPGAYPGDAAQDPQRLEGKILRLGKDGSAAGGVAGWNPYVYALGWRNPFGLAFGADGTLYAAENGILRDELNVVAQGGDYGWPECEGACGRPDVRDPLATWEPSSGTTGAAFLGGKVHVAEFDDGRLRAADAATGATSEPWSAGASALDVAAGPDGCLYVSGFSDVWWVDVQGTGACRLGAQPPTPATPPTPTVAPTPATPPSPTQEPSPTPTASPAEPTPAPSLVPSPTPGLPPTGGAAPPSPPPGNDTQEATADEGGGSGFGLAAIAVGGALLVGLAFVVAWLARRP